MSEDLKALRDVDPASMTLGDKVSYAWRLFFPQPTEGHARADAKKRLRMILVADRCALSSQSLAEMKRKIVEARLCQSATGILPPRAYSLPAGALSNRWCPSLWLWTRARRWTCP